MSAHTPGPWRVHRHQHVDDELWLSIGFHTHDGASDPGGRWIGPVAELKYLTARDDEQWANANLIAAAPDLLALARSVAAHFKNTDAPLGAAARAVIAKAEGREP